MKPGIQITKIWSDDNMLELKINVSDGASAFSNKVYVGCPDFTETIAKFENFKTHVHGGLSDITFGKFGPEYANGAFHARFHFPKPGKLYVICRQESDFENFSVMSVASKATLYLKTEPVLLDDFISQLKDLDARKRDEACLEADV